jgi:ABC-type transport system involved in multi-copper enzyme maturation permease subunit
LFRKITSLIVINFSISLAGREFLIKFIASSTVTHTGSKPSLISFLVYLGSFLFPVICAL